MKRKPKAYKAGSRSVSVIKIFCESMHSTLCGSPNISLTRRSPPPPERETKFSKKGNQNPIKLNDDQEVSQYITSPQNILWICVGRQIWAWRGERLNLFEEIGSFTQRQIQTCSKGSSDHRRPVIIAEIEVVQCLGSSLYWYILAIFQSNVPFFVTFWEWTTSLFWKS